MKNNTKSHPTTPTKRRGTLLIYMHYCTYTHTHSSYFKDKLKRRGRKWRLKKQRPTQNNTIAPQLSHLFKFVILVGNILESCCLSFSFVFGSCGSSPTRFLNSLYLILASLSFTTLHQFLFASFLCLCGLNFEHQFHTQKRKKGKKKSPFFWLFFAIGKRGSYP